MAARKSAPTKTFDYACLGDAEPVARDAAGRIAERTDSEALAKAAWTLHGLDILHVRRTAKHGHFEGWVKLETPFTVRLAQMMSDAAAMLSDHLRDENFSRLPPLDKAITYTLAAPSTPQAIRDEYLPRLLAGEKGLRKLVLAALKPETAETTQADDEAEPVAVPTVPARDVVDAVDSMTDTAFRTVMRALSAGRVDELTRALEWRAAKPVVPHADWIAERAKAAARTMPLLAGVLPEETVVVEADAADVADAESKAKSLH
jgi:hypothetical protein